MVNLGLRYQTVSYVKPSLIRKEIYDVMTVSSAGKRINIQYNKEKMEKLLQHLGLSAPEELKGRAVVINDKKQVSYLPEGAKLIVAVKDADGKITEIDFQNI